MSNRSGAAMRSAQKRASSIATSQSQPEQLFWSWIQECTQPRGWIRYSPSLARALGSDRHALVLSYAIHLDGRGSGYYSAGRWFYKSMSEWSDELAVPLGAVERALDVLCIDWHPTERQFKPMPNARGKVLHNRARPVSFGLLHRWLADKQPGTASAVYHYRVDWPRLAEWWTGIRPQFGQLPLALTFSDLAVQYGKKFHTGMEESAIPVRLNSPYQCGLFRHTSEEDIQKSTSEEGQTPGDDDAPAAAVNGVAYNADASRPDHRILYMLLLRSNIAPITATKLVEELAQIPLAYVEKVLDRITGEQLDATAGRRKSSIRSWPAFKVSSLRSLVNAAQEGFLEKYMQATYGVPISVSVETTHT